MPPIELTGDLTVSCPIAMGWFNPDWKLRRWWNDGFDGGFSTLQNRAGWTVGEDWRCPYNGLLTQNKAREMLLNAGFCARGSPGLARLHQIFRSARQKSQKSLIFAVSSLQALLTSVSSS